MAGVGEGLLVTDMFGPSINPNTGDYSVGVAGFWFENGEIAYPVSEVTIAGDLPSMFSRLVPASNLEFRGTRDAPSILVEGMSLVELARRWPCPKMARPDSCRVGLGGS